MLADRFFGRGKFRFGGNDAGEEKKNSGSRSRNNQTGAKATKVRGKYACQPGEHCTADGGAGKESAEPFVVSGAGEHERNQKRKDGSESESAEDRERDDTEC